MTTIADTHSLVRATQGTWTLGRCSVDGLTGRSLPRPAARLVIAVAATSAAACLCMVLRAKPAPQTSTPIEAKDAPAPRASEEAVTRA
ncbi:MAG TPA: hypothetical protein VMF65_09940 [Acidimicrobiales bacterium]|nr:hypothetical protein [Acidimicrobiales bacterium]